jgi:hypothetical protein
MALRSYDGVARVVKGISCVGIGGRDITLRVCLDGFDFLPYFLPAIDEKLPSTGEQEEEDGGGGGDDE